MKRRCVFVVFFAVIIYFIAACETVQPVVTEGVEQPEVIIIKDELAVPMTESPKEIEPEIVDATVPLKWDKPVEKMYIVMESANVTREIADGKVDEADFVAEIQGTVVTLGEEINDLLSDLGWPDGFEEMVSNPRLGSDKEFIYEGIVIHTNPENRKDIVNSIEYCGEEKTQSGIGLGSTRADIEAAYGIDYIMDPDYIIYDYGNHATINFQMEKEECVHIEFCWR